MRKCAEESCTSETGSWRYVFCKRCSAAMPKQERRERIQAIWDAERVARESVRNQRAALRRISG